MGGQEQQAKDTENEDRLKEQLEGQDSGVQKIVKMNGTRDRGRNPLNNTCFSAVSTEGFPQKTDIYLWSG